MMDGNVLMTDEPPRDALAGYLNKKAPKEGVFLRRSGGLRLAHRPMTLRPHFAVSLPFRCLLVPEIGDIETQKNNQQDTSRFIKVRNAS
jgi:hypothetical protein